MNPYTFQPSPSLSLLPPSPPSPPLLEEAGKFLIRCAIAILPSSFLYLDLGGFSGSVCQNGSRCERIIRTRGEQKSEWSSDEKDEKEERKSARSAALNGGRPRELFRGLPFAGEARGKARGTCTVTCTIGRSAGLCWHSFLRGRQLSPIREGWRIAGWYIFVRACFSRRQSPVVDPGPRGSALSLSLSLSLFISPSLSLSLCLSESAIFLRDVSFRSFLIHRVVVDPSFFPLKNKKKKRNKLKIRRYIYIYLEREKGR